MRNLTNYWRSLTPLTQNIGKITLVNFVILLINCVLILLFLTGWKDTELFPTLKFLLVRQGNDSWEPMSQAFNYIQEEHQKPLYSEIFFEKHTKFQYPPTSLLSFYFLQKIDTVLKGLGISWFSSPNWFNILNFVSWIFVIVIGVFVIKIFDSSLHKNRYVNYLNHYSKFDLPIRYVFLCCLILIFYPVVKAYSLGQIQVWINSLFTIVFWCWMKERKGVSGVLLGVICLIKPQYSIIFLWGLLRKQWSFTLAFAITTITICLFSFSIFGVAEHINYLSVLSFISKHGEAFYANQSMNGLLNRLLFNGNNLNWQYSFPPFNPWVYIGTTITSLTLIGMALLPPKKANEKAGIIDFSIIALTCTIASPVAWEHHYGILLPIYAFLLPGILLNQKIFGRLTIPYLYTSYVLSSHYFAISKKLALTPLLNIAQSYLFIGGLMLLVCLYVLRRAKTNTNEYYQLSKLI